MLTCCQQVLSLESTVNIPANMQPPARATGRPVSGLLKLQSYGDTLEKLAVSFSLFLKSRILSTELEGRLWRRAYSAEALRFKPNFTATRLLPPTQENTSIPSERLRQAPKSWASDSVSWSLSQSPPKMLCVKA